MRVWQSIAAMLIVGLGVAIFTPRQSKPLQFAREERPVVIPPGAVDNRVPSSPFTLAALRRALLDGDLDLMPGLPAAPYHDDGMIKTPSLRPDFNLTNTIGDPS